MKRRDFLKVSAVGDAATAVASPAIAQSSPVRGRTGPDQQHTYYVTTGTICVLIGSVLVRST